MTNKLMAHRWSIHAIFFLILRSWNVLVVIQNFTNAEIMSKICPKSLKFTWNYLSVSILLGSAWTQIKTALIARNDELWLNKLSFHGQTNACVCVHCVLLQTLFYYELILCDFLLFSSLFFILLFALPSSSFSKPKRLRLRWTLKTMLNSLIDEV